MNEIQELIKGHIHDEEVWLEASKQGLIDETKNNFGSVKFDHSLYHIYKAEAKLEILKRLLKEIESGEK